MKVPTTAKMYCATEEEYDELLDLSTTSREIDILNAMYYRAEGHTIPQTYNIDKEIKRECHDATIAAKAREDVLKALRTAFSHVKADDCFGEMNSDKCYSYNDNGECFLCAFDSIAESLRSEVRK